MNDTITYDWSENLARASLKAVYKDSVARLSFLAFGGALIAVVGFSGYFLYQNPFALAGGAMGLVFIGISVRVQLQFRSLAKDAARLADDTTVSVAITDDSMTIASAKSTRTVDYTKLTQLKECNGFLLLYAGKLLVASLPKDTFRDEHVAFLKSKIGRAK